MTTNPQYPKRLIEVDLPIKKISAHARREKSIRHGHISTLHIWWARRPLAACRAVICAALWPDPADEQCPQAFRDAAATILADFAEQVRNDAQVAGLVKDHWSRWNRTNAATFGRRKAREAGGRMKETSPETSSFILHPSSFYADLRYALLDFIADFANWDASTVPAFLNTARALTQAAHESLGGLPGTRPLVVDPFAGGGAIPLEALRVGADAFASDLNPVAVLLNKVVLEYIPKYGQQLADEVRKWGQWIKEQAEQELAEFYPKDPDGATPIAYLWARTIKCEGPNCGAEIPLLRSLWLAKKSGRSIALRILPDPNTRQINFEIIFNVKNVGNGTVRKGSATCPICGFTTPNARVRAQLAEHYGGAQNARMVAVVCTRLGETGRLYRLPTQQDIKVVEKAKIELKHRAEVHEGLSSLIPDEPISDERPSPNARGLSAVSRIGMTKFGDLFAPRQLLWLTYIANKLERESDKLELPIISLLALALGRQADQHTSVVTWLSAIEAVSHTFTRQAIQIAWDYVEPNPFSQSGGNWDGAIEWIAKVCEATAQADLHPGNVQQLSATLHPLPSDSVAAFITDPPYYDSVPYADLSDFFYVWLHRSLKVRDTELFASPLTPKDEEAIWNPSRVYTPTGHPKDVKFYEEQMRKALAEGRRLTIPSGIGVVVFAHKSTSGWEAILEALINAGWVVTASWPIDTERGNRVNAIDTASLVSSIHLICRPREAEDGHLHTTVGDWRDVLQELPQRIHAWLPRLAQEGVVGADAIFACLGPALEIYSRYSRVEKASGSVVSLKEYLEQVWAAVAKEALNTIFEGADTTGFEPDARLTAIWFWTLKAAANGYENDTTSSEDDEKDDEVGEGEPTTSNKKSGYLMEYDAVRKLAQGLGADLTKLSRPGGIITISGNIATLNGISHRQSYLIGQQQSLFGEIQSTHTGRSRGLGKTSSATMKSVESRQISLFDEEKPAPDNPDQPFLPTLRPEQQFRPLMDRLLDAGVTVLDRLHQAMLLFGRSQTALLGPFLQETYMGDNPRFWQLANALLALYPPGTEEKRWVEGVLARKKGLGF